jgi:hypothetical protein
MTNEIRIRFPVIARSVSDEAIPFLKLIIHYKKRSQKRKEKCLDFC